MKALENLLNKLEEKIQFADRLSHNISKSNVGWHIEHSLLTIRGISHVLIKSNPADYQWTFNYPRYFVLILKKIPRGKAKAPEVVSPKGILKNEELLSLLYETRSKLAEVKSLSDDKFFKHPYLGNLKRRQAIKFLIIHTKHHLAIINDIIGAV